MGCFSIKAPLLFLRDTENKPFLKPPLDGTSGYPATGHELRYKFKSLQFLHVGELNFNLHQIPHAKMSVRENGVTSTLCPSC